MLYPRFKVIRNSKGLYILIKLDTVEKKYIEIPSYQWTTEEDAQARADELNCEEGGFIEIDWDIDL